MHVTGPCAPRNWWLEVVVAKLEVVVELMALVLGQFDSPSTGS